MPPIVTKSSRKRHPNSRLPVVFIVILLAVAVTIFIRYIRADRTFNEEPISTPVVDGDATDTSTNIIAKPEPYVVTNDSVSEGLAISTNVSVNAAMIIRPNGAAKTAEPIKRRQRGTAEIIEAARARGEKVTPEFVHPSENFFSLYARPGIPVAPPPLPDHFEEDAIKALEEDIVIYDDDSADVEELKCIVAGIKEELRTYLNDGGTVLEFVAQLKMRQAEEERVLSAARGKILDLYREGDLEKTYIQWLETNKELAKQGIMPVQLPRGMRKYLAELEEKYGKGNDDEN